MLLKSEQTLSWLALLRCFLRLCAARSFLPRTSVLRPRQTEFFPLLLVSLYSFAFLLFPRNLKSGILSSMRWQLRWHYHLIHWNFITPKWPTNELLTNFWLIFQQIFRRWQPTFGEFLQTHVRLVSRLSGFQWTLEEVGTFFDENWNTLTNY